MKALNYSLVCMILVTCAGCQKSAQERFYERVESDAQKAQAERDKANSPAAKAQAAEEMKKKEVRMEELFRQQMAKDLRKAPKSSDNQEAAK
ncbi:MAG: hypothetical protein ABSG25_01810 [Bryobacteraceae bacterium]|jgi:hypothetical protein